MTFESMYKIISQSPIKLLACTSPFIVGIVTDNTSDDVAETNANFDWSRGIH